jgi:hypothetical protein
MIFFLNDYKDLLTLVGPCDLKASVPSNTLRDHFYKESLVHALRCDEPSHRAKIRKLAHFHDKYMRAACKEALLPKKS